jgi:hypothetical protein
MKISNVRARLALIALLSFVALSLTTAADAQGGRTRRVKFAPGRTTAVLKGSVIRGERDTYVLGASAGQTMTVHITSTEKNAVFQIYAPNGSALQGAEEEADATDWQGELPRKGDYKIVVGGTRGNATYTLEVTIR